VKQNKQKVEKGTGFTRYLLVGQNSRELNQRIAENLMEVPLPPTPPYEGELPPIEYFYLEEPSVPEKYFPLKVYGIYDRITLEEARIPRLKEDIIRILGESKKFGVWVDNPSAFGTSIRQDEIKPDREENSKQGTKVEFIGNSNIEITKKKRKKNRNASLMCPSETNLQEIPLPSLSRSLYGTQYERG
jgi:hypothetical protein